MWVNTTPGSQALGGGIVEEYYAAPDAGLYIGNIVQLATNGHVEKAVVTSPALLGVVVRVMRSLPVTTEWRRAYEFARAKAVLEAARGSRP